MQENNTPLGMGAVESERDLSKFDLGSLTPTVSVPATFMPSTGKQEDVVPSYGLFVENQSQQPACGSHAGYEVAGIFKTIERGAVFHGSPEYLWDKIKQIDGLPIADGTNMPSILKVLATSGICSADLLPNNAGTTLAQYADASKITPEMDADAANNRIGPVYAFGWSPTMDALKAAIYAHKAVILLVRIGDEFWLPSWKESDILPLKSTRPITSGHFITAFAYDEKYIYFYNHWSKAWGRMGIGYFGENYLSRVLEYGTAVNLAGNFQFVRHLKYGMTGTDVGVLQAFLRSQGFWPATQKITSYLGSITLQNIQAWQLKNGLSDFAGVTDYSAKSPIEFGPRSIALANSIINKK